MNDNFPQIKDFDNTTKLTEKYVKLHYCDFYAYLMSNYDFCNSFQERLYCYFHNVSTYPKCPVCGKNVKFKSFGRGYRIYCSNRCLCSSNERQQKIYQTKLFHFGDKNYNNRDAATKTNIQRYGCKSPLQNINIQKKIKEENKKKYGSEYYQSTTECKEKTKQTFVKKYGVENCFANNDVKQKIKNTWIKKYGVDNPAKSDEIKEKSIRVCLVKYGKRRYSETDECKEKTKQNFFKKYGFVHSSQLECVKQKIYDTKKKNNSFNKSNIEEQFASWLDENNISYIRQYKSEQYPFCCDFYFPEKDLYFEINGHCVHNNHPFNPDNKKDIATLEKWKQKGTKFYKNMIHVWTVTDPLKVKTANENNLNFKVVYSCDLNKVISEYGNTKL